MLGSFYFYDYYYVWLRIFCVVFYEVLKKIRNDEIFFGYIGIFERDFFLGILEVFLEMEVVSVDRFCEVVCYIVNRSKKNGRVQEFFFNFNEGVRVVFLRILNVY